MHTVLKYMRTKSMLLNICLVILDVRPDWPGTDSHNIINSKSFYTINQFNHLGFPFSKKPLAARDSSRND